MSISTKERKNSNELLVGWDEFKVVAINPEREQLNELLGVDKTDELEYLSEDDEGNRKIRLTFWIESVKSGWKQSVSFWLTNKERTSKENPSNKQYVNQYGKFSWDDEGGENLELWFKNFMKNEKPVGEQYWRVAFDGEEAFVRFLSAWLLVDRREGTGILPDYKELFKGNLKELNSIIGNKVSGNVLVSVGVKTKEIEILDEQGNPTGEKEKRDYQSVFNKDFLPGEFAKYLRSGGGKEAVRKQITRFENSHKGDYGFKDFFIFQEAKPYNPEDNISHSEDSEVSTTGNDYN
jgi:hypothetical protein